MHTDGAVQQQRGPESTLGAEACAESGEPRSLSALVLVEGIPSLWLAMGARWSQKPPEPPSSHILTTQRSLSPERASEHVRHARYLASAL